MLVGAAAGSALALALVARRASRVISRKMAPLAHMTQSAVKSHNGPAHRVQSVGGACR